MRNVACVMGVPPANFGDTTTSCFWFVGHWANTAQTDHVTLTFDFGGHDTCGWCGSSSSIHIPSLKFGIRKIWRTIYVSALMDLVTLIFVLLILKLVRDSHLRWGTLLPNLGTLGLWILELFAMHETDGRGIDGQTDGQKQRLLPLLYGLGIIRRLYSVYLSVPFEIPYAWLQRCHNVKRDVLRWQREARSWCYKALPDYNVKQVKLRRSVVRKYGFTVDAESTQLLSYILPDYTAAVFIRL